MVKLRRSFDIIPDEGQNRAVLTTRKRHIIMKKILLRILRWGAVLLVVLMVALALRGLYAFRDRVPGYTLDLRIDAAKSQAEPRPLRVGFGRVKINPDLSDPKRPVWVAGFSQNRAATAIHDDIWAIACVLDDGHTRPGKENRNTGLDLGQRGPEDRPQ